MLRYFLQPVYLEDHTFELRKVYYIVEAKLGIRRTIEGELRRSFPQEHFALEVDAMGNEAPEGWE